MPEPGDLSKELQSFLTSSSSSPQPAPKPTASDKKRKHQDDDENQASTDPAAAAAAAPTATPNPFNDIFSSGFSALSADQRTLKKSRTAPDAAKKQQQDGTSSLVATSKVVKSFSSPATTVRIRNDMLDAGAYADDKDCEPNQARPFIAPFTEKARDGEGSPDPDKGPHIRLFKINFTQTRLATISYQFRMNSETKQYRMHRQVTAYRTEPKGSDPKDRNNTTVRNIKTMIDDRMIEEVPMSSVLSMRVHNHVLDPMSVRLTDDADVGKRAAKQQEQQQQHAKEPEPEQQHGSSTDPDAAYQSDSSNGSTTTVKVTHNRAGAQGGDQSDSDSDLEDMVANACD